MRNQAKTLPDDVFLTIRVLSVQPYGRCQQGRCDGIDSKVGRRVNQARVLVRFAVVFWQGKKKKRNGEGGRGLTFGIASPLPSPHPAPSMIFSYNFQGLIGDLPLEFWNITTLRDVYVVVQKYRCLPFVKEAWLTGPYSSPFFCTKITAPYQIHRLQTDFRPTFVGLLVWPYFRFSSPSFLGRFRIACRHL
jgi:hypothetical protein